ncbi:carbohydrate ABC transporter permease, partial [Microlunatus capsulatus]
MRSSRRVSALRYVVLSVLALLFLLPFYVLLRNGFSSERLLASAQWRWLPDQVNADNLRELFGNDSIRMARSMANSAVVAVVQTLATVVISALAGYGLARIDHRLSRLVLGLTVLTLMVPAAVTFIPSFVLVSSLGWISTLRGLIIPVLFSAFATFLFRQFFLGFPHELEEAAYIDG